ncbi:MULTISPECIES: hypothetical protein [unclassified Amycolatopsis]|uniref:WD40/YVTN/BNR-like repeat-containing protein n=1 Tax=unclassified Amycolatopsis TaxID=2618356 RepID=UPI001C6A3A03|nr:hypothetical protein [Amycolatopsis sp. DSM 110486]QYN21722.1 hypothetical protein K1T34_04055 [Amycolatopsis sp. DSM 110486]
MKPTRCAAVVAAALAVLALVPASATAAPDVSAVPAGFAPASTSWTGPEHGFVLGYTDCGEPGWCPVLLETTDGGAHWRRLGAPPMSLPDNHNHVRLVAASAQHLYVTDGSRILATRDGGRHWFTVLVAGGGQRYVSVLAETGGRIFAVVTSNSYGNTTSVYSGLAGAPVLAPLPGFEVTGGITYGDLATGGGLQIALGADYRTEEYWTSRDGVVFTPASPPCPSGTAASLGGVRAGQVIALCSSSPGSPQPGSSERRMWRAPKLGGTFSGTADAPAVGITQGFSAATADTATVAAEGGGDGFLHHTTDGGRTWTTTVLSDRGVGLSDLAFVGDGVGVVVDGLPDAESGSAVYRTTDTGRTWVELSFS